MSIPLPRAGELCVTPLVGRWLIFGPMKRAHSYNNPLTLTLRDPLDCTVGTGTSVLREEQAVAYTVKQVAALSGVSVRTLHFYDETDLLKPAYVGTSSKDTDGAMCVFEFAGASGGPPHRHHDQDE